MDENPVKWYDVVLRAGWVLGYAAVVRMFRYLQRVEGGGTRAQTDALAGRRTAEPSDRSGTTARLFLCLVAAVCLASSLGCRSDPRARAEAHFAKAQEFLQVKKTNDAIVELREAIQAQPTLAKAHFTLAKIYLGRGNFPASYQELVLATHSDPENKDAQLLLADLLLRAGNFQQAHERAELIEKKWPGEITATLIRAEAEIGLRELGAAQKLVDKVLRAEPNNARCLFDLATLQIYDKAWTEAEASLQRAWELQPSSLIPGLVLSNIMEVHGDRRGAEEVLQQLVAQQPSNVFAHYALANYYLRQRVLDKAESEFRRVETLGADDSNYRAALAQFYATTGRLNDAEQEYKRILAVHPQDWPNWRRLAEFYFATDRRADAKEVVKHVLEQNPQDWSTLMLRGQMETENREFTRAVIDLQQAAKSNPDSPLPPFYLANAFLQKGDTEQARVALGQALQRDSKFLAARLVLAALQLQVGSFDEAIRQLNDTVQEKTTALQPYLMLSEAYAMKGEFRLADENLQRLAQRVIQEPNRAAVFRTLAWVKFRQGRYPEAQRWAARSLEGGKDSAEGLYLLGLSFLAQHRPTEGLRNVQARLLPYPNWARGYEVLGRLALQAGNLNLAQQSFRRAWHADPRLLSAALELARVTAAQHQLTDAQRICETVLARDPHNAQTEILLGLINEQNAQWDNAIAAYKKALEFGPSDPVAKNNLAWLYAEHGGNLDLALRLSQEAREAAPENPHIADTLAWICIKKGAYETALPYLKESVAKMPNNPTFQYHLGLAYFKLGRPGPARDRLIAALRLQSNFEGAAEARKIVHSLPSN